MLSATFGACSFAPLFRDFGGGVLAGGLKFRPSWRNIVRVLRHADVWSVRIVADSESALRSPWVLLLRNLMLREISRIVAKCCTTVPCCHQTIVKKEFVRLRDSNFLVGDW